MRHLHGISEVKKQSIINVGKLPLSEYDIITLHKQFLSNGFHTISGVDVQSTRKTIFVFLQSLNYYHNIGFLSFSCDTFHGYFYNIYKELLNGDYLNTACDKDIEQFFLEHFFFDFIWIEESPALLKSGWYIYFKQKLIDLNINKSIPIITVNFEKIDNH